MEKKRLGRTSTAVMITFFGVVVGSTITPLIAILVQRGNNPEAIAFYRLFFISLLLFPTVFLQKHNRVALKKATPKTWFLVLAYALTKGVNLLLWSEAIRAGGTPFLTTTLGNLSLVFLMILCAVFYKERYSLSSLLGIVIALGGVAVVGISHLSKGLGGMLPIIAIITASFLGSVNTLLAKSAQSKIPIMPLITLGYGISGLFTFIVALIRGSSLRVDAVSLILLICLGCISTLISHSIPIWAVSKLKPVTVQLIGLPSPFFTAFVSYLLLGQLPTLYTFIGGIIMVLGLLWYLYSQYRATHPKDDREFTGE